MNSLTPHYHQPEVNSSLVRKGVLLLPTDLLYASVNLDVVTVRYRTPASYQSRPPYPPSQAALKAALARAAAQIGGRETWESVLKGVVWCSYSILRPFSSAIYLVSRIQPPEQRERNIKIELKEEVARLRLPYRPVKKGDKIKVSTSPDPASPYYKKPSNVFPVGEFLTGSLNVVFFFNPQQIGEDLIRRSLLGVILLGDNDSLVTPAPSSLRVGRPHLSEVLREDHVITSYVFSMKDAVPVEGGWLLAKLPADVGPKEFTGPIRVVRKGFDDVVIPARKEGDLVIGAEVKAKVKAGRIASVGLKGAEATLILPKEALGGGEG